MSATIPVPLWLVWLLMGLTVAREYFLMRRDEAIRDLWRTYLQETADREAQSATVSRLGSGSVYDAGRTRRGR